MEEKFYIPSTGGNGMGSKKRDPRTKDITLSLSNGSKVFIPSEARISDNITLEILIFAMKQITRKGEIIIENIKVDYFGYNRCVQTDENSKIVYVLRSGKMMRFVTNAKREFTNTVGVLLERSGENQYILMDCFWGEHAPMRPQDSNHARQFVNLDPVLAKFFEERSREKSNEFWAKHALAHDEDLDGFEGIVFIGYASYEEEHIDFFHKAAA